MGMKPPAWVRHKRHEFHLNSTRGNVKNLSIMWCVMTPHCIMMHREHSRHRLLKSQQYFMEWIYHLSSILQNKLLFAWHLHMKNILNNWKTISPSKELSLLFFLQQSWGLDSLFVNCDDAIDRSGCEVMNSSFRNKKQWWQF